MMDGLAATVPPGSGLRYVKGAQGQCIYHPDAVRRVLGTDAEGEKLDAMVRELVDSGHRGRILGYGYDEFDQPPGRRVRITLGGKESVHGVRAEAESKQDAAQVWLEPLPRELQEARRKGATLADIRAALAGWRPDTHALADVFAANAEQGFFGVQEEQLPDDVAAANPYGCNQYEHGEGCEHPSEKKGDKKAEEKKQEPPKKELSA